MLLSDREHGALEEKLPSLQLPSFHDEHDGRVSLRIIQHPSNKSIIKTTTTTTNQVVPSLAKHVRSESLKNIPSESVADDYIPTRENHDFILTMQVGTSPSSPSCSSSSSSNNNNNNSGSTSSDANNGIAEEEEEEDEGTTTTQQPQLQSLLP
ncbi:hypothetical protein FDP41_000127 [Naegleria fowleri]|uniref:Uncharacterized protein n=1 Tax=Naegleria fowleri TaxID=5763 RepID=A0A6A5CIM3_NAEFO|nr:uncharacterized protein FDP41_000127 [Naegleria fowleri]KAF0985088.1 hypothetical protein FDP41_000127 [Naegleria fowleri]CAG4716368.1 unnamed protein product [Naegleria fowleri]